MFSVNKKSISALSLSIVALLNLSFSEVQTNEVLPEEISAPEAQLPTDSTINIPQKIVSTDTINSNAPDTSTLSDDDIIMVDEDEPETNQAAGDSIPPIEKMPVLKMFVEADYPEKIYKQGIEGVVLLELLVNDSGVVDSVSIIKGIHPELDSSAIRAARRFSFIPAVAGGETVPVLIQYEYRFELKEVVREIDEQVNFRGTLIERGTKKPISDAMVVITFIDTLSDTTLPVPFSVYLQRLGTIEGQYLEEDRLVTITDSSGNFRFFSLPACTILVSAPLPGYEELDERELITPREEISVNYYIRRVSYSDYEVVVRYRAEEKEVSRRQITLTEVKRVPGLGGDAVKVVQAMPGVARPIFGSGGIVVRGAPTWDSQFYLDGIPLPRLYHIGGLKSVYNSDALAAVDFYPGGFNTRYGNGIAGVVEITGRSAKTDRWHGNVDLSVLDGSFLVEGPVTDNLSIMGSARRSFIGDILGWYAENSDMDLPFSIAPFYWDYTLRGDYTFSKNNQMYLTLFGGGDSLTFVSPIVQGGSTEINQATDQLDIKQTFYMGILGWDYKINDKCENSLRYSLTFDNDRQSSSGPEFSEYHSTRNNLRNQLTCLLGDKSKVNVGLDFDILNYDMVLIKPQENGLIQNIISDNWIFGDFGVYLNFEWKPFDRLLIIPGLRYDYYPELHYDGSILPEFWDYTSFNNRRGISGEPSLRLTTRYEFIKKHTAKLSVGNYSQTPKPLEVIHKTWGDPGMPATKAAHYVFGYEWQITDLISSDIQFYMNRQWDIPRDAEPEDLDLSNTDQKLWLGDGKGRMYGMEIMLRHDMSERFFGWLAYSLSKAQRYNPIARNWELFGEDETHNIQLVASWHLRRDWDLGLRARYVTGKPTTPVIGSVYDENGNFFEPIFGDRNSDRLGPFFQLDLRVDKKFVFDKWMFLIYLDIINSNYFFYKSPEIEVWNEFYDVKTTISNIFIPALGFRAEF